MEQLVEQALQGNKLDEFIDAMPKYSAKKRKLALMTKIEEHLKDNPNNKYAHYLLGILKHRKETIRTRDFVTMHDLSDFDRAIDLGCIQAMVDRAFAISRPNRIDDFLPVLIKKAIEKEPNHPYIYRCLGNYRNYVSFYDADVKKYKQYCLKAIALGDIPAKYQLSEIYLYQGKYQKAIDFIIQENLNINQLDSDGILAYRHSEIYMICYNLLKIVYNLTKENIHLYQTIKEKEDQITELQFRPGGEGFEAAKEHFESLT